jgi:hypothetical protein
MIISHNLKNNFVLSWCVIFHLRHHVSAQKVLDFKTFRISDFQIKDVQPRAASLINLLYIMKSSSITEEILQETGNPINTEFCIV